MNADQTPCRVCGCIEGEPGLCHAILIGKAWRDQPSCHRIEADLCCACNGSHPTPTPGLTDLAARCEARAHWSENAAAFRGRAVPGAWALRRHAAEMRLKCRRVTAAAAQQSDCKAAAVAAETV